MSKHLVIVAGGHAHLTLLANLGWCVARVHRVTVVNRSAYHYYSGMGMIQQGALEFRRVLFRSAVIHEPLAHPRA